MTVASSISVTEGSGKLLDTVQVATGAGTVEREGVFIGDPDNGSYRAGVNSAGELKVNTGQSQALTDAQLRASAVPVQDGTAGNLLLRILKALLAPLGYDKSLGRFRNTAIIESGTVTTVTGLTNIDGRNGAMLVNTNSRAAWALSHRARIT